MWLGYGLKNSERKMGYRDPNKRSVKIVAEDT